jgi:hypothetical protein
MGGSFSNTFYQWATTQLFGGAAREEEGVA